MHGLKRVHALLDKINFSRTLSVVSDSSSQVARINTEVRKFLLISSCSTCTPDRACGLRSRWWIFRFGWTVPLKHYESRWSSRGDVPTTPGAAGRLWAPAPACREVGSTAPSEGRAAVLGSSARWSSDRDTINRVSTHTHRQQVTLCFHKSKHIYHEHIEHKSKMRKLARSISGFKKGKPSPHKPLTQGLNIIYTADIILLTGVRISSCDRSENRKMGYAHIQNRKPQTIMWIQLIAEPSDQTETSVVSFSPVSATAGVWFPQKRLIHTITNNYGNNKNVLGLDFWESACLFM